MTKKTEVKKVSAHSLVLDLHDVVNSAYTEEELAELAKEKARKSINEGLTRAFNDIFSSWSSPFNKAMEAKLNDTVGIALDNIKLPEFADLIGEAIGTAMATDAEEFKAKAVAKYTKMIKGRYQKEWKMSELIFAMMDCVAEEHIDHWYTGKDDMLGRVSVEGTHRENYKKEDQGYPSFVTIVLTGSDESIMSTNSTNIRLFIKGLQRDGNGKEIEGSPRNAEIYKTSRAVEQGGMRNFTELNPLEMFLFQLKTRGFVITEFDEENYPDGFYASLYGRRGSRLEKLNVEWPDTDCLTHDEVFEDEYCDESDEEY